MIGRYFMYYNYSEVGTSCTIIIVGSYLSLVVVFFVFFRGGRLRVSFRVYRVRFLVRFRFWLSLCMSLQTKHKHANQSTKPNPNLKSKIKTKEETKEKIRKYK